MELDLRDLFKNAENVQNYVAGQTIFVEGQPGDAMYVVLDGEVDIRVKDRSIAVAGPGNLVGEMALIDSSARSADAIAITHCKLAPIDEKKFVLMVEKSPYFALHVMKVLAERLRHMDALK
jgi:CRP-like cAMP-binding protein